MGTLPDDPLSLIGTTLEGKYAIESYVAKGGFGVVYRAQHLHLRRPVAVKLLRLERDVGADERDAIRADFEEEARNVAHLDHPALVRVLDFGVSEINGEADVPWMVAEWMDGQPLSRELKARRGHGGRSPEECLTLLRPVFDALTYAHEIRIVHRDIKPANLMFTGAERGGARATGRVGAPSLKLLDFGIAKVMEPEERASTGDTHTTSQHISFSMKYGAPEQFSGARTGPWTDIHAMGLLLTEMLTDRPPYEGRDTMDFHLAAMSPQRPTPGRYDVDVGPWEAVIAKALALRPTDRYASLSDFLKALEEVVPEVTRPTGSPLSEGSHPPSSASQEGELVNTGTLPPVTSPTPNERAPTSRRVRIAVIAAAVSLSLAAVVVITHRGGNPPADTTPARVATPPPRPAIVPPPPPPRLEARDATAATSADASVAPAAPAALPGPVPAPAHADVRGRRHRRHRVPIQ